MEGNSFSPMSNGTKLSDNPGVSSFSPIFSQIFSIVPLREITRTHLPLQKRNFSRFPSEIKLKIPPKIYSPLKNTTSSYRVDRRFEKFGIIFAAEESEWQSRLRRIERSFPFILSPASRKSSSLLFHEERRKEKKEPPHRSRNSDG